MSDNVRPKDIIRGVAPFGVDEHLPEQKFAKINNENNNKPVWSIF